MVLRRSTLRRIGQGSGPTPRTYMPDSRPLPTVADISAALEGAPQVSPGHMIPGEIIDRDGRFQSSSPNVLMVSSRNEIEQLIDGLYVAVSQMRYAVTDANRTHDRKQIAHEAEHAAAAESLGVSTGFALRLGWTVQGAARSPIYQLTTEYAEQRLTNLEWAAIAAAPSELFPDDHERIASLGFRGQREVAQAVAAHNRSNRGRPIPLPLPFRHLGSPAARSNPHQSLL